MRSYFSAALGALLISVVVVHATRAAEESAGDSTIDFARDIAPMLTKNCVACHNSKKAEGGLNLETHTALMAESDSGNSIVAKSLDESFLLARVTGEEEPLMPPEDNAVGAQKLTSEQIELLRLWILRGAEASQLASSAPLTWQRLPPGLQPVYALATSADGLYLAYGRGSLVTVTSQSETGDPIPQSLVDSTLNDTSGTQSFEPATHLDIVQSIAFSPDSQRLATGGFRTVKIWRRSTSPLKSLAGLSIPSGTSAYSPDGRWLAMATAANVLEITDCVTGQSHRYLKAHSDTITGMVWLHESPQLISCDASGKFAITHATTYQSEPLDIASPVTCQALYRIDDSQLLAVDQTQQLCELALQPTENSTGWRLAVTRRDDLPILTAAYFCPHPTPRVAVALEKGVLQVLAWPSCEQLSQIDTQLAIREVTMSRDGSYVAAIPQQGPAQVWRTAHGELVGSLDADYDKSELVRNRTRNVARQKAHIELLTARIPELQKGAELEEEARSKIQTNRDEAAKSLAAKTQERETANNELTEAQKLLEQAQAALADAQKLVEAKTTELETKKQNLAERKKQQAVAEKELIGREQALAAATDSAQRATALIPEFTAQVESEKLRLADLEAAFQAAQSLVVKTNEPLDLIFSPDSTHVFVAHADQRIRVYATGDSSPTANLPLEANVHSLHVSNDHELSSLSVDGQLLTWNLELPWFLETTLGGIDQSLFSDRITGMDFSPDGRWLAVGSGPPSRFGDVKIVDVHSGTIAKDLGEAHSDTVLAVKFSPDGRQLATAGADKLCHIFEVESGTLQRTLEGHTHHILGIAWRDNGQVIVTASADATLKVWNVENGTQNRTISGFTKEISAVTFVGQSGQLVVISADGKAWLYNSDDGKQLRTFAGAENALYALGLSAKDDRLFAGGQAGKIWAWKLDDGKLTATLPQP
jgi:WD40 repeat protein